MPSAPGFQYKNPSNEGFLYGQNAMIQLPGRGSHSLKCQSLSGCCSELPNNFGRKRRNGLVVGQEHLAVDLLQKVGSVELVHYRPFDF